MKYTWDNHYPDSETLKAEAFSMANAFVEVLLEEIPETEIEGIYCKGSVLKEWEWR